MYYPRKTWLDEFKPVFYRCSVGLSDLQRDVPDILPVKTELKESVGKKAATAALEIATQSGNQDKKVGSTWYNSIVVCFCVCLCVFVCLCVCVFVFVCVRVCVYICGENFFFLCTKKGGNGLHLDPKLLDIQGQKGYQS